MLAGLMVQNCC